MEAIKVEKLSKVYKKNIQALNELSLSVRRGEVFTLLGSNGAGKSSLINILTTFLQPTSGKVNILGKDLLKESTEIRREISCVAQKVSIDDHLTLRENMIFQGRLYKMDIPSMEEKMGMLINSLGLQDYTNKRVSFYSGGIKRRLDITMSLMSSPKILFLDEPTVGMDIESRRAMWDIVRQISQELNTTVFLTTHYLEEADKLSDTICIMQEGHEIIQDTPINLKRYTTQQIVRVSCNTPETAIRFAEQLSHELYVNNTFCSENILTVMVEDGGRDYDRVIRLAVENCIPQTGIEIAQPNLDDVFLALTHERRV